MAARKTTTTRTTRETRMTSRAGAAPAPDVVVVDKPSSVGFGEAIGIVTTLILIGAIVMTDYLMARSFGKGVFF